jgi:predicted N-acyltransferase
MNISFPLCQTQAVLMPYCCEIFSSVAEIPFAQWQRLVHANNLMFNYEYLNAIELNQNGNMEFRYVFIQQNEQLVGVAYFQIVPFKGTQLSSYHASNALLNSAKNIVLPLIEIKMLVGANLLMTGEKGFFFHASVSAEEMADAYLYAVQAIFKSDPSIGAFLMTDVFEQDMLLKNKFQQANFYSIYEEPDMVMDLQPEWKNFDDYLQSLSSKYRVRAKKCFSLSTNLERKSLSIEEVSALEEQICALYHNTIAKSTFALLELKRGFFAAQKKIFGERYMIFGYFLNGKLVGFNSLYCNKNAGEVHYIGLDYEVNKTHHIYQKMLYDMVDCGIGKRFEKLHFGRTAPEIKSTVGAVPVAVSGLLKHRNFFVNRLVVKPLAAAIKPKDFIFRNPFK